MAEILDGLGLLPRPALDHPDRLFVVIGPRTFSAAMNLVLDLEHWTHATFVGEPTGNATMCPPMSGPRRLVFGPV